MCSRSVIVILSLLVVTAATAPATGQVKPTDAATEQEILRLERQWMDAVVRKDRAALDAVMADDFALMGETWAGERDLTGKSRYIENSLTLIDAKSFAFDKPRIQSRGDVAVFHGLFTSEAVAKGKPWKSTARISDTWVKDGGRWRVLARHASTVTGSQ